MNKVSFDKVSFEQFKNDWLRIYLPYLYQNIESISDEAGTTYHFFAPDCFGIATSESVVIPSGFTIKEADKWEIQCISDNIKERKLRRRVY